MINNFVVNPPNPVCVLFWQHIPDWIKSSGACGVSGCCVSGCSFQGWAGGVKLSWRHLLGRSQPLKPMGAYGCLWVPAQVGDC